MPPDPLEMCSDHDLWSIAASVSLDPIYGPGTPWKTRYYDNTG